MQNTQGKLILVAALALGLSATAGAGDHRGEGYRNGDRHQHESTRRGGSKFRAPQRAQPRAHRRDLDRWSYRPRNWYRDDRRFRHRHWRHRQHYRAHRETRRHWRAHRRHDLRAGHRHRRGGRICYSDHRYERSAFTIWLDGIGFTILDRGW